MILFLKKGIEKAKLFFSKNGKSQYRIWNLFFICLLAKFLGFDFLWSLHSTFTSFSKIETFLNTALVVLILLIPYTFFRAVKTTFVIFITLDLLFIVNMMYFHTYYTAIPLDSYGLATNLKDFTASVYDSFRWGDLFFPLSTFLAMIGCWKYKEKRPAVSECDTPHAKPFFRYLLIILLLASGSAGLIKSKNGYKAAYESLQNANMHTCGTPMYTLFGSLYYDYLRGKIVYTPEIKNKIEDWLANKPAYRPLPPVIKAPRNCILILAESLESWVLEQKVEGKEITPYLNRLLQDSTTLYAPHVLTQVKGGRSIDAQLLFNAGLLPIMDGAYSTKYPNSFYPTIVKAFKEKYPDAKAYAVTVDKKVVWNQGIVASAFGYDYLLDKDSFKLNERVGPHKKLGDVSFFRQCAEKIRTRQIWNPDTHNFLQCVTYSGHNPFILPEKLKRIFFSDKIPKRMNDYMTMANYTDRALGKFIESLKQSGVLEHTMVIITGDHEGLADFRAGLCRTEAGKGIVSDQLFTPFIVINSPVGMRYEPVMGQVDIYPTLLNLLHIDTYFWKGMGQSILDPCKEPFAINPQYQFVGDTVGAIPEKTDFLKKSWTISDLLIRCDYWGRKQE